MNDTMKGTTMNPSITRQVNALTGLILEAMRRGDWDTVAALRAQAAAIAEGADS